MSPDHPNFIAAATHKLNPDMRVWARDLHPKHPIDDGDWFDVTDYPPHFELERYEHRVLPRGTAPEELDGPNSIQALEP